MSRYPSVINLHMHTVVSDGTDTPEEIAGFVREAGIGLFSITDHDAVKCAKIMPGILKAGDPRFVSGVEFSCRDEEGKYHILGYGFDPDSEGIRRVVDKGHGLRMKKVRARLDFLRSQFGFVFPEEGIQRIFSMDNPGKPHIANLMVELGYAPTKEAAIKDYINQIRFRTEYVRPEEAISGILSGGGIPVLAHPFYGSGDQLILGEEMDERLRKLIGFGLQGVEAFYSGFTEKLRKSMIAFAEQYDLYITAGSDYHGKNKLVPLADTGLPDTADAPEGLKRFLDAVLEGTGSGTVKRIQ